MIAHHVLARRPLVGTLAGLLLVSACGTAVESTSTPTPTAPTTLPPATSPPPTVPPVTSPPPTEPPASNRPPADAAPIDAVDVSGRTIFDVRIFDAVDVDAVSLDVSARLGSPTTDSGWEPTTGQSCAGATHARVLWWGDFRMTFERYEGDGAVRDELSAWTVGDPTLFDLAPIGDVPAPTPSDIVTVEGIGLGSTLADVGAVWVNVNNGGDRRLVVVDRGGSLTIGLDDDDHVVGLGDGPFDCPVDEMR